MYVRAFAIFFAFLLACCTTVPQAALLESPVEDLEDGKVETEKSEIPLVIVGEGGTSGFLFQYAADTYISEHGGVKFTVHDGDEFISAIKSFVQEYGLVTEFIYMGHGNEVGLYVNQAPHINGALYVNDPALDADFRAASIYELPPSLFASGSTSLFYGCNVARELLGQDSFAEQFANHFRTIVSAPTGPTEFSFEKDGRTFQKLPADAINQPLYMVPTAANRGFVSIVPSLPVERFDDVYASMESAASITNLTERGLVLDAPNEFRPYQSITYRDAQAFCHVIDPASPCIVSGYNDDDLMRNTAALKLLLDTAGFTMKKSGTPYERQIAFGNLHNLLPRDFVRRKWLSRAEMAMMTWDILRFRENGGH